MGMRNLTVVTIALLLFLPAGVYGGGQKPGANVNSKYDVESVELSGASQSRISKSLREDMQKLVGEKYDQEAANELANRLRSQLNDYSVSLKVKRGNEPDHVKVVFEAERTWWKRFEVPVPTVVYESKEGLSGSLDIPIEVHHNVFGFGLVNTSDELLERYSGFRFRYENRKIATDRLQFRMDFNTYHETFNNATQQALLDNPDVPGIYRTFQDFAPSLSVIPFRDLKLSVGTSFVRLQIQYPGIHTMTAYAGTANLQYRHRVISPGGVRQSIRVDYNARSATRVLDSDYVYSRHFVTAHYTLIKRRNLFGAHFMAGYVNGTAPLFERFSIGNSFTLRGWNKFDVAPLGGTRLAHGSLEYRYRDFQLFYDVGTVWDKNEDALVRHGIGFGLATRDGFFASLAFPVRLHDVSPIFMLGFRFGFRY